MKAFAVVAAAVVAACLVPAAEAANELLQDPATSTLDLADASSTCPTKDSKLSVVGSCVQADVAVYPHELQMRLLSANVSDPTGLLIELTLPVSDQ